MTDDSGRRSGEQFDEGRFEQGQALDSLTSDLLDDAFGARNVVHVEPDEAYDNFTDEKHIHQLVDYTGIDWLVDTFHAPLFGVNHRNHFSDDAERFDIRADTGSAAPAELDTLQKAGRWDIVPKFASRLKAPDNDPQWFRVVDLQVFTDAIQSGLGYDLSWSDGQVTAWMYDYDKLRERDAVVADVNLTE